MQEPQILSLDGHRLAALPFDMDRPGTPVVCIHGITSSIFFWTAGQTALIRDQMPWISLSLPGHHPATLPTGFRGEDLTAETITGLLAEAVRSLTGGRPAHLIGHSTGGFAVLAIAASAPELVRSVVSVSGFAHGRWTGILGLLQRLARLGAPGRALFRKSMKMSVSTQRRLRYNLRYYVADREALYATPTLDATLKAMVDSASKLDMTAMQHYFARMPDIDITGWLPRISAPTLAITGDQDPIVPPAQSHLIAEQIPGAELVVLPGSGHLPMAERAGEYHATITRWLQATES